MLYFVGEIKRSVYFDIYIYTFYKNSLKIVALYIFLSENKSINGCNTRGKKILRRNDL